MFLSTATQRVSFTPLCNIIKTTASKPSNNCLTPLLFSDFSHHANHLLIALYGKNHGSTLHGIKWHCLIFASQPLLTGSEHRAACGRWSGAMSRKKQGALRSAPSEQGDYVSDRKGRWFESNRGSQIKALSVLLSAFYFLYGSKSFVFFEKWAILKNVRSP